MTIPSATKPTTASLKPIQADFRVEREHNGNKLVSCLRFHAPTDVLKAFDDYRLGDGGDNPFHRRDGRWVWRLVKKEG